MAAAEETTSADQRLRVRARQQDQHEHAVVQGCRRPRDAGVAQELGHARRRRHGEREGAVHQPAGDHGKRDRDQPRGDGMEAQQRPSAARAPARRRQRRCRPRPGSPARGGRDAGRRAPVGCRLPSAIAQSCRSAQASGGPSALREGRQMRAGRPGSRISASYSMRRRSTTGSRPASSASGWPGWHITMCRRPGCDSALCSSSA